MTCNRAPQRQRNDGVGIAGKAHINDPRSASDKPIQPTDQCHHIRDGSAIRVGIESVGDSQLGAGQQSPATPDQDRGNGAGVLAGRRRSAGYELALDDAGTAQVLRCRVDGGIEQADANAAAAVGGSVPPSDQPGRIIGRWQNELALRAIEGIEVDQSARVPIGQ